ncbi:hypothetical protein EBL89_03495 [Cereibacter sphaeroides]|nr:hypothetical protein EBL89_03495 [Cereibacter sphaeroides]
MDDLPPPETGLPVPPDLDADSWDVMGAGWKAETIRTDAWSYTQKKRQALASEIYDRLTPDARQRIADQRWDYENNWTDFEDMVIQEATTAAQAAPEAFAGLPLSRDQFDQRIDAERKAELEEAQAILDQPGGLISEFVGTGARAMTDQTSLMMAPFGVTGSAWKTILGEAVMGGLGEAAVLPREYQVAGELGLPEPDPLMRIGAGAVLGGGLAAGVIGIGRGISHLRSRRAGVDAARALGADDLDATVALEEAEAALRGDRTVQEVVKPASASPEPGTLGDVLAAPGGLPPIGPDAPEGWGQIRNGIFAGESGGDYDALLGFSNRKGGEFSRVKLTRMTVDQAIAFSDPRGRYAQWAKSRVGRVATPMGAYQIVGSTLRNAKRALGLQGDELMTPALQERLGHWIYRTQGTGAWVGYRGPRDSYTPDFGGDAPSFTTSRGYTGSDQVTAGDAFRIDVGYEVVELSSLSRATGDLQPRDRSRVASDAWIADTAARLDPAQLMPSPTADRGAPIVGPDGVIESGNGRTAAIARAYERHPDRALAYRQQIEAAGFQIPAGIQQPVLIARRQTELSPAERGRFVIEAQDSGVAAMTPTEVARASSRAMTPEVLARFDPLQALTADANGEFVRSALAGLPRSARNAMFDAGGMLNKEGQRRLREALFARAWPDPEILARFTETDAGELKSLLEALDRAAPAWAALRADIESGRIRPEMDIGPYVLDAMRLIGAARDLASRDGLPIARALDELLDEVDLLDGAVAPLTAALVRKFWRNGRAASADEVASFLTRFADDARKAGGTATLFEAPGPREILQAIDPKAFGKLPEDLGAPRRAAPAQPIELPARGYDDAAAPEAVAADVAALEDLKAQTGSFGPILTRLSGDWRGAVEELRRLQTGEVPGALTHPDVGPIALVWGDAGRGRNTGFGLAKIIARHSEVLDDLQARLEAANVISRSENRIRLASPTDDFVIRLDWDGEQKTWLMTGYERERKTRRGTDRRTGRADALPEGSSPSAPPLNENTPSGAVSQGDQADEITAAIAAARAEIGDIEIEMPDGTTRSAAELLDDLDADAQADAVLQACAIGGAA